MKVRFRSQLLEDCYRNFKRAVREWGKEVATRYVERVNVLYRVKSAAELGQFPALRFHALRGDRKGQYAITLTGFMRLIVTFDDSAMTIVQIEEVSKHYGD
jgi:proteic killer suppression protein